MKIISKIKVSRILVLGLGFVTVSCSIDDGPEPVKVAPKQEVVLSDTKEINNFSFLAADNTLLTQDIVATIDEATKTVYAEIPSDTDLTELTPTIVTSSKATINPTGVQDFSSAVVYTVTAEDGTKADYTATFSSESSAKEITSFVFLISDNTIDVNVVGTIDQEAKTITLAMPPGTNITGLLPEIEIPDTATVDPNTAQNFTQPVVYTVTAEDDSEVIYTVTVTKLLTQKGVLQAILDANPNNILDWDLPNTADSDLGTLQGVTTDVDGIITKLFFNSSGLTSIPSEIGQLVNLTRLSLSENSITSIPSEIGQLVNLTKLFLYENSITSIPSEIGQLVNLTVLGLSSNNITEIPSEIGQLVNLTELFLNKNDITEIPSEIGQLVNLTLLYLFQNNITRIPSEIGQLVNLTSLRLNKNSITSIPEELGFLINLERLFLENNDFFTLPQAVSNLRQFNNVDLNLTLDFDVFIETTSQKDALISIYSANPNNTLGWGVDNFTDVTFNENGDPRILVLHSSNLERLPNNINFLKDLEVIAANGNQFTTVPPELAELSKLVLLTIERNPIESIPQSVCNQLVDNGGVLTIVADTGEGCN